jgi:hypothetical protein
VEEMFKAVSKMIIAQRRGVLVLFTENSSNTDYNDLAYRLLQRQRGEKLVKGVPELWV